MIIRVRTQLGTWKVKDLSSADTFSTLRHRLEEEHHIELDGVPFSLKPNGSNQINNDNTTLGECQLNNGDMIYMTVDESKVGVHERTHGGKQITKDGNIVQKEYDNQNGFRPGMLPLRNMKMHWTLHEFIDLDSQFTYKIKRQENAICKKVVLDKNSLDLFQRYNWKYNFQRMRVGYLYGKFNEDNTVNVSFIYEPPQDCTDAHFEFLEDPLAGTVDTLAGYLEAKKVGWVFAHPPRENGFFFSGPEIIAAAEMQLLAAEGVADTPFVTVKVTLTEEGNVQVEGYQVSKQCMEMAAEGALQVSPNLGRCAISASFTAIMEGKETKEVDNNFFLTVVPIEHYESKVFVSTFPPFNRPEEAPTVDHLRRQLEKAGKQGWTLNDMIADFYLLLFLCQYLDIHTDLEIICKSVLDKSIPVNEGYILLIRSFASMT